MFKLTKAFAFALTVGCVEANLRFLSEQKIAGTFTPETDVLDHSRIDRDQQALENYLAGGSDKDFQHAKEVYEKGGFSKSIETVTLTGALGISIKKGTQILGQNAENNLEVKLVAYADYDATDSEIQVQYVPNTDITKSCYVGGLQSLEQITLGCLAPAGSLIVNGGTPIEYTKIVNSNGRTLAGFSTGANKKMRPQEDTTKDFFADFALFEKYYGSVTYADDWVQAGFSSSSTKFNNGNQDFSKYKGDKDALSEVIKKGTAFLNVWMYVIREMDDALDDCARECPVDGCNDDAVHALDEAVAFYAGSLATMGGDIGVMPFALAEKRADDFITNGKNSNAAEGESYVNIEIFRQFDAMKNRLLKRDCTGAQVHKERVAQLMQVPLIQGTIRYAHKTGVSFSTKGEAEGATFAAGILPILASCNAADAETVHTQMMVGKGSGSDLGQVKAALERNYECMKVDCDHVGGIWDESKNTYFEGAAPCVGGYKASGSGSSVNVGLAVGLSVGIVVAILLVFLYCKCCRNKSSSTSYPKSGDVDPTV